MEFPELAAAVAPQVRKTRNLPADAAGGYHIRKVHIAPLATPCGKSHTPRGKPGKAPSPSARPTPSAHGAVRAAVAGGGEYPKCYYYWSWMLGDS
jgi:hypothetical protein